MSMKLEIVKELHRGSEYVTYLCKNPDTDKQYIIKSPLNETVVVTNRDEDE